VGWQCRTRCTTHATPGTTHATPGTARSQDWPMPWLLRPLAIAVFVALAAWCFGGLALRVGGVMLFAGTLLTTAETASLAGVAFASLGGLAWLGGHWLYAVRHHYFTSPLARHIFFQVLPRRLDPTRRWGIRTLPDRAPLICTLLVAADATRRHVACIEAATRSRRAPEMLRDGSRSGRVAASSTSAQQQADGRAGALLVASNAAEAAASLLQMPRRCATVGGARSMRCRGQ
jgi:hypothetical protein